MPTQADITKIAPEFTVASVGQPAFDLAIADSALMINAIRWGTRADMAQRYLAAHLIALAFPDLSPPLVTREMAGGVSRDYAIAMPTDQRALATTRFGRVYLDLLRMFRATPIVP